MSWQEYITSLMTPEVKDACICGSNPPSIWASEPGGFLSKMTTEEIAALASPDRTCFRINGLTLGSVKCSLLRDDFEESHTMDLRTKCANGPTFNVVIAKGNCVYVILVGKEGVHGGTINPIAYRMARYLCDLGM